MKMQSELGKNVEECKFALKELAEVGVVEKEAVFTHKVKSDDDLLGILETAAAQIKDPAILAIRYKKNEDGKSPTGHCMAIMPDQSVIDVASRRYWYATSQDCHSISKIRVVRVVEEKDNDWLPTCRKELC